MFVEKISNAGFVLLYMLVIVFTSVGSYSLLKITHLFVSESLTTRNIVTSESLDDIMGDQKRHIKLPGGLRLMIYDYEHRRIVCRNRKDYDTRSTEEMPDTYYVFELVEIKNEEGRVTAMHLNPLYVVGETRYPDETCRELDEDPGAGEQ
jgi:hypothetical protein